jgi:hypothetical protein
MFSIVLNIRSNSSIFQLEFQIKSTSGSCVAGTGINIWNSTSLSTGTEIVKRYSGSD